VLTLLALVDRAGDEGDVETGPAEVQGNGLADTPAGSGNEADGHGSRFLSSEGLVGDLQIAQLRYRHPPPFLMTSARGDPL
jgi:hypothetical protein